MVLDEHQRAVGRQQPGRLTEDREVGDVAGGIGRVALERVVHLVREVEPQQAADALERGRRQLARPTREHLQGEERAGAVEGTVQQRLQAREVDLADVLCRVDPEAGHAHVDELVEVPGDGRADVVGLGPQVGEAEQLALGHLQEVVEVVDAALGGAVGGPIWTGVVEIGVAVEAARVRYPVVRVGEVRVVHAAVGHLALAGHVVDDGVDVHLHAGGAAGGDHGAELRLGTHPAGQLVVHRLVHLPPRMQHRRVHGLGAHQGVLRRGDLHAAVPGGAERVHALVGHRGPVPLEQVGDHVVLATVPATVCRHGWCRGGGAGERGYRDPADHEDHPAHRRAYPAHPEL